MTKMSREMCGHQRLALTVISICHSLCGIYVDDWD